jgi:hypothetical protein
MVAEKNSVWRLAGSILHDPLQRMDEAEVEHLVGFVEHQDLDAEHDRIMLIDQIEQAARRGDEHVDALGEIGLFLCMKCRRTRS